MKTLYTLIAILLFTGFTSSSAQFLTVSPTGQNVGPVAGTTSFNVTSLFSWTVKENVTWLTAKKIGSTIAVSYSANSTTVGRTGTIVVTSGASIKKVYVVQAPTGLVVAPSSRAVTKSSGSTTFSVNANVSWTVSDNVTWAVATKTSISNIAVTYQSNPTINPRTATISVKGNGVTRTVTVNQAAGDPSIKVKPDIQEVDSQAGTTSFAVSANVSWGARSDDRWISLTKVDEENLSVKYAKNTSTSPRTAVIEVYRGSTGKKVQVIQEGAGPFIDITPDSKSVNAKSGNINFSVSSNVTWTVSDDVSWLTATKADGSTINAIYDKNPSTSSPRTATITATGGGISESVTVTQAALIPYLDVSPGSESVSSGSGSVNFSVSTNVDWSVSDDASWLTATKTDGSTISASYDKNTSTSPRTATITVTGGGITRTVTVTQAGADPYLEVSPDSKSVSSESGSTSFSVSSNVTWTVSDDVSWLTATKADGSTISASYDENTSTSPRTATITATGGGITKTVTVTQAGASAYLDVSPDSESVSAESGSTSFSVSANVDWSVSDDASWLTATKSDGSTISVSYDENTSTSPRSATITATGGGITKTVTVTQAGASAYLDVSPDSESVSSVSGSINFSVSTNVDWSASDDASWLTATKTDGSTISVSYDANTTTSSRSANITASGGGVSETVTLTQEGEAIAYYIDLSTNSVTLGCASASASVTVSANVDWSVVSSESWLVATKTDASTLTIDCQENTDKNERSATLTLSGGGLSRFVSVVQEKADATSVDNYADNQLITIYPNPAKDVLYLKTESEFGGDISIDLFDIRGMLIHSKTISQPTIGEIISIDISLFKSGIYFIRLNNSKAYKIQKL